MGHCLVNPSVQIGQASLARCASMPSPVMAEGGSTASIHRVAAVITACPCMALYLNFIIFLTSSRFSVPRFVMLANASACDWRAISASSFMLLSTFS